MWGPQPHIYKGFDAASYTEPAALCMMQNHMAVITSKEMNIEFIKQTRAVSVSIYFTPDGARLHLHAPWGDYLICCLQVPRLELLLLRHFQGWIEELQVLANMNNMGLRHAAAEVRDELQNFRKKYAYDSNTPHHRGQILINGIGTYDYHEERTFSKVIPHTIVAIRAVEEIFSMTADEYYKTKKGRRSGY